MVHNTFRLHAGGRPDGDLDTAILRMDTAGVSSDVTIGDVTVNEGGTANIVVTLPEAASGSRPDAELVSDSARPSATTTRSSCGLRLVTVLSARRTTADVVVENTNRHTSTTTRDARRLLWAQPAGWTVSNGS